MTSPNLLNLNNLPGKTTVSLSSAESPQEEKHRLDTARREHINTIILGWVILTVLAAIAGASIWVGMTHANPMVVTGAWTTVGSTITGTASFFAGRFSNK